jgi:hypothetical protein
MGRVKYIDNKKYIKIEDYEGIGIYQQKTPSDFFISQSYLINSEGELPILVESYNHKCKEEIYDMIDNLLNNGKIGCRGFVKDTYKYVHDCGNVIL